MKQPKQTELCRNKPKKSRNNVLYYRVLKTVNFFSRFEPKQTENKFVLVVFRFAFPQKQKKCFGLFRCFGPVSKQPKQTELMVWGIKKVGFFNKFAAVSVETTETNVLFRIVPKLVSVPISVVSIRN